jgi:hypothetical protein
MVAAREGGEACVCDPTTQSPRAYLKKRNDHGQCVFSAPTVFSLDPAGNLSFRHEATDV